MYKMNNLDPSTEPCGTPSSLDEESHIFLQTVFGHLNSCQSISLLHREHHRNLTFVVIWSGSQYQMLFFKSMKTRNVYNLLSIDSLIYSTRSINACEVDIDDRQPY